jgi:hypothetical protein
MTSPRCCPARLFKDAGRGVVAWLIPLYRDLFRPIPLWAWLLAGLLIQGLWCYEPPSSPFISAGVRLNHGR